jgi:hypothetical protein
MTGSAKRKGDRSEIEACGVIYDLTGYPVRRRLGAGRRDDVGDLDGVPDTVIQVANWADVAAAAVAKPREAEVQRVNADATFAATFVRFRGGLWRVVLTPEQWATYAREAAS